VSVESVTVTFQVLVLLLPPVVGFVTYALCRALARSGAERLTRMPLSAFRREASS
jgi:hypothetical protein